MKIKLFILSFFLFPGVSSATEMYKCTKNGHSSYQDKPCGPSNSQTQLQTGQTNSMIGCYVAKFPAFESSSSGSSEPFEVRASASSGYELQFQGGTVPLKRATPDELREVSKGFHVHLSDGFSVRWPQGTPNQKPVGVYEGHGEDGKTLILAFFFMSNGLATRVSCR
jgi:hypothetical protein